MLVLSYSSFFYLFIYLFVTSLSPLCLFSAPMSSPLPISLYPFSSPLIFLLSSLPQHHSHQEEPGHTSQKIQVTTARPSPPSDLTSSSRGTGHPGGSSPPIPRLQGA